MGKAIQQASKVRRGCSLLASAVLVFLIRCYQKTRFLRQPSCRFYPSCSEYMLQAIGRFGVLRGLWFGLGRLFRCHPFHAGGIDQISELEAKAQTGSYFWHAPRGSQ